MHLIHVAWLVFSVSFLVASQRPDIYYVRPNDVSSLDCFDPQCLTFDEYVEETNSYFRRRSIFIFMAGNHTLQANLNLNRVSNILLRGSGGTPNTDIVCKLTHNIEISDAFNITITGITFLLYTYEHDREEALLVHSSTNIAIINVVFNGSGNTAEPLTRAISSFSSNISIIGSKFFDNTASIGGAITANEASNLTLINDTFVGNAALQSGGAISLEDGSTIVIRSSVFTHNVADEEGGAISCYTCTIVMQGNNNFSSNRCKTYPLSDSELSKGGAIYTLSGLLKIPSGRACFCNNYAQEGGAIYVLAAKIETRGTSVLIFESNTEGAVALLRSKTSYFQGSIVFENNSGQLLSTLYIVTSFVDFNGISAVFTNNSGQNGGAMQILEESTVTFKSARFDSNSALAGGAIYCANSELRFHIVPRFINNRAITDGGALYASETNLTLADGCRVMMRNNSARNGGAMYLRGGTFITLKLESKLLISNNCAHEYGGGIFYEDSATTTQCTMGSMFQESNTEVLPYCFVRYGTLTAPQLLVKNDTFNTAGKDGGNLYGGQLDKCRLSFSNSAAFPAYNTLIQSSIQAVNSTNAVSSKPYKLCFCDISADLDCTGVRNRVVHRGQKTSVSLIALGQGDVAVSTFVRAVPSNTAKLDLQQNFQTLPRWCTNFTYTIYSTESNEELLLYSDGPCHETGLAKALVQVKVLPCPDGFSQFNEQCICEERLLNIANCTIDIEPLITKREGSKLWLSGIYKNGSYEGLILYDSCPQLHCKKEIVNVNLKNPDVQCEMNRSGVLCGTCAESYSLMLGNSQCGRCSNTYLSLILLFALAGFVLTGLLIFFRLTVATGMINGIILYANMLQVNRNLFFPVNTTNVLTVFIAWINLDFGIKICFFDGLNEYLLTWLQFAFPLYIWILISVIIFTSRYSTSVSRLIGSNPIAVLATLLLMSYTKILKILVETYSFVVLDYPNGRKVYVWLKDANIVYLESKHLALIVVTSLVLVIFFLPYTLLLLLGHKIYRFSGRKYFKWFGRMKPLLESYYAPYGIKTRYWTGFLLLVRCALYAVFSYNSVGGEKKTLLAIIITFTGVIVIAWLSVKIYRKFIVNAIEASIYLNLIILSSVTLAGLNSAGVVYTLVALVFAMTMAIIAYHFHTAYIAKSELWNKIETKAKDVFQTQPEIDDVPLDAGVSSHDPTKLVTVTQIDLREPLLDI